LLNWYSYTVMQITTVKKVLIFIHGCRNGYPDQFPSWFFSGAPLIRMEPLNMPQLLNSQFQFSISSTPHTSFNILQLKDIINSWCILHGMLFWLVLCRTKCSRIPIQWISGRMASMILGKWPTWHTILFYVFIFIFNSLHASSTSCSSSGDKNHVNTTSGSCHSASVAMLCAGRDWTPDLDLWTGPWKKSLFMKATLLSEVQKLRNTLKFITTSFINFYFACIFVSDTIHTLLNMVVR
jgi:hypothetical protein